MEQDVKDAEINWDDVFFKETNRLYWYHYIIHLGYYVPYWLKFFFSKPFKEEKKELNTLEQVQTLVESSVTDENLKKCDQLVYLHRIIENTRARRRLEKWSLRVIAFYLVIVLFIVLANYYSCPVIPDWLKSKSLDPAIPSEIMITILSTTTINIIGLGLIVLKGHFLAKESLDDKEQNPIKHDNTTKTT